MPTRSTHARATAVALLATLLLCSCGGGGNDQHWNAPDYSAINSESTQTFTLHWYTGNATNGGGDADGYVTLDPGGEARGFPTTVQIPRGATVTVTAHPTASTTTVDWQGLGSGPNPLVRTFVMSGDQSQGCSFLASGFN